MYTLCPKCGNSQQISRKKLKKKQGQLTCSTCKQPFNGYLTLSKKPHQLQSPEILAAESQVSATQVPETDIPKTPTPNEALQIAAETETEHKPDIEVFAWQKDKSAYRADLWLMAVVLGIFVLMLQIYYFKAYSFSQNPQIRPWLNILGSLPDYRKPLEFTTVGSSLDQADQGHYRLQVSLINHADFAQPPPYLQLTLNNFYGGMFAQRVFSPQEYLGKKESIMPIKRSASLDINFLIAMPEQEIGGYSVELK